MYNFVPGVLYVDQCTGDVLRHEKSMNQFVGETIQIHYFTRIKDNHPMKYSEAYKVYKPYLIAPATEMSKALYE